MSMAAELNAKAGGLGAEGILKRGSQRKTKGIAPPRGG